MSANLGGFDSAFGLLSLLSFLLLLIILVWGIATYNRLINLRNLIAESWSDIDTELRRRYDLIPNLIETVRGYAAHERSVLERVAEARARALASASSPEGRTALDNELVRSLRGLFAVSEGYPALKADRNFLDLQRELINTEDRIQAARRFFNGNVRDYNNMIQCFPSSLIASLGGFQKKEYYELEDLRAREPVQVRGI